MDMKVKPLTTTAADFCETRQDRERKLTFQRQLDDGNKLEVTIKSEGQTTFQPPPGWTLTANDIVETRCLSLSQSMRFPHDADTTQRLQRVVNGSRKLSRWERLRRWLRRK